MRQMREYHNKKRGKRERSCAAMKLITLRGGGRRRPTAPAAFVAVVVKTTSDSAGVRKPGGKEQTPQKAQGRQKKEELRNGREDKTGGAGMV